MEISIGCVFVCEKSVKGIKWMKPNTKPRSMNDWSIYKVHKKKNINKVFAYV